MTTEKSGVDLSDAHLRNIPNNTAVHRPDADNEDDDDDKDADDNIEIALAAYRKILLHSVPGSRHNSFR